MYRCCHWYGQRAPSRSSTATGDRPAGPAERVIDPLGDSSRVEAAYCATSRTHRLEERRRQRRAPAASQTVCSPLHRDARGCRCPTSADRPSRRCSEPAHLGRAAFRRAGTASRRAAAATRKLLVIGDHEDAAPGACGRRVRPRASPSRRVRAPSSSARRPGTGRSAATATAISTGCRRRRRAGGVSTCGSSYALVVAGIELKSPRRTRGDSGRGVKKKNSAQARARIIWSAGVALVARGSSATSRPRACRRSASRSATSGRGLRRDACGCTMSRPGVARRLRRCRERAAAVVVEVAVGARPVLGLHRLGSLGVVDRRRARRSS